MVSRCILLLAVLSATLSAETVVKKSAPFTFPVVTGTIETRTGLTGSASFFCTPRFAGREVIKVSWTLPAKAKTGAISFFTASGVLVKKITLSSQNGSVEWDISGQAFAHGIYLAKLSCVATEKTQKLIL